MKRQGLPPKSLSTSASKSVHRISRDYSADRTMGTSFSDPFCTISKSSSFQMMDITISVEVMDGLVMEVKKTKDESPLGSTPINAVISAMKNVSSSRKIATHVPSLPLSVPKSSYGDKFHKLFVRWPVDFDPHGDALSTFRFSRLMKREVTSDQGSHNSLCYQPENIELTIGLMRGSEMITLGKADLVIHGNEFEEIVVDIPVCTEKDVVNPKKLRDPSPMRGITNQNKAKSTKVLKPLSFPSDSKRKFHLADHSMIRVQVKTIPQTGSTEEEYDASAKYPTKHTMTASTTIDSYCSSRDESVESSSSTENQVPLKYLHAQSHRDAQVERINHQLGQIRLTSNSRNYYGRDRSPSFDEMRQPRNRNVRSGSSSRDRDHSFYGNDSFRDRSRSSREKQNDDNDQNGQNQVGRIRRNGAMYESSKDRIPKHHEHQVRQSRSGLQSHSKRDPSPIAWVYDILVGNDDEIVTSSKGRSQRGSSSSSGNYQNRSQSRRKMMV